ncbi:MAG: RNA polymerase sigma factor [Gammaproteobacteria bacterium]|nr:MAG: RNA polymerase sigma factor [Gammaproteobacteria bacterium]
MGQDSSDEDLMMRYRDGDAGAFEVLYRRHKGPLYRYILRQCGRHAVDELFQDVWTRVIQARERYQASASFKTFLFHIARNRLVDHYRRQGTGRDFDVPDGIAEESIPARVSDQPERQVHAGQQIEQLLMLVRDLPAEQREAFLLHEEAGLAVAGIAEVTGVGHETAKSRLRYALQRLREGLREWV